MSKDDKSPLLAHLADGNRDLVNAAAEWSQLADRLNEIQFPVTPLGATEDFGAMRVLPNHLYHAVRQLTDQLSQVMGSCDAVAAVYRRAAAKGQRRRDELDVSDL